jgi:hypothetical protein
MIEIDWLAAVQRGLAAAKNTEHVEIGGSRVLGVLKFGH